MSGLADLIVALLLVTGGVFGALGSWALVRLPDPMTRLHGPTKAATLGVGAVLIASMIHFWAALGTPSWHELLIALFLFLTAPLTGLFLAKAHIHLSWDRDELPPPAGERGGKTAGETAGAVRAGGQDWATFGDSAAESPMVGDPPTRRSE